MRAVLLAALFAASPAFADHSVVASWYGHGRRTADGKPFNPSAFTAAHRTLPFGTRLLVSCRGRSVVVRVNDRGPWTRGRGLDLSRGAASALGIIRRGSARVTIKVIR